MGVKEEQKARNKKRKERKKMHIDIYQTEKASSLSCYVDWAGFLFFLIDFGGASSASFLDSLTWDFGLF